jgi:protein-disulfide isomerase
MIEVSQDSTDSHSVRRSTDWAGLVIATCAIAMTALVGYRELRFTPAATNPDNAPPLQVEGWAQIVSDRPMLGQPAAPVKIVEFGDFQCPFCAGYVPTLDSIRAKYAARVAVVFVNFPLSYHPYAIPAARAALCAWNQGRFDAMYHALYKNQSSFSSRSWQRWGTVADLPDRPKFKQCVNSTAPLPLLARDTTLGNRIGVNATPTILVNGWMWKVPPTYTRLDSAVQAELRK